MCAPKIVIINQNKWMGKKKKNTSEQGEICRPHKHTHIHSKYYYISTMVGKYFLNFCILTIIIIIWLCEFLCSIWFEPKQRMHGYRKHYRFLVVPICTCFFLSPGSISSTHSLIYSLCSKFLLLID